jgi:hypothetical protein
MNEDKKQKNWNLPGVLMLGAATYLIALLPLVQSGGGKKFVPSVFAVLMIWVWAYVRGYKIVWRDESRWMAVVLFGIPCVVSLAGLCYAVYRFYIL